MTVGVVIVTHNSAHFIAETLESVKRQTQLPDFIAVIDDHSTDNTIQVVREQLVSSGIQYVIHPATTEESDLHTRIAQNFMQGVKEAQNTGMEIIVLGDHDDLWHEHRIAQHVKSFEENPTAVMVAADGVIKRDDHSAIDQTPIPQTSHQETLRSSFPVPANFNGLRTTQQFSYVMKHSVATGGASAIKPEKFHNFDVPKGWLHDRWWSLAATAHRGLVIDTTPVIEYRITAEQQVGLDTANQQASKASWLGGHLKRLPRTIKRTYDLVPLYIASR